MNNENNEKTTVDEPVIVLTNERDASRNNLHFVPSDLFGGGLHRRVFAAPPASPALGNGVIPGLCAVNLFLTIKLLKTAGTKEADLLSSLTMKVLFIVRKTSIKLSAR